MEEEIKKSDRLYKAQECIHKMEIASLIRYAFIIQAQH